MFVNCPHCQSLVAVDAVSGAAPEHCPYCDGAIAAAPADAAVDAEPDTAEVVPADSDTSATDALPVPMLEKDTPASHDDRGSDSLAAADAQTGNDSGAQAREAVPTVQKSRKTRHPSFANRPVAGTATASHARWPWPVALLLMLLLLLQLIVADRASLAAQPRWRATIGNVCKTLRCDIPPWRETAAFTMLARDVQAHPGIAGALRIRAAFRNDARWPQPWPQLVVTLSDASGRVTGSRTFTADEYLGAAPTQKLITTGQIAAVALEIEEPAPDTVSFSFDFR